MGFGQPLTINTLCLHDILVLPLVGGERVGGEDFICGEIPGYLLPLYEPLLLAGLILMGNNLQTLKTK